MQNIKTFLKKKIVGIDFGTTNSSISILNNGKIIKIKNLNNFPILSSLITFTPDNKIFIGKRFNNNNNYNNIFYSIKRLIGCTFKEISENINFFSYFIRKDLNSNFIKLYCPVLAKNFYPEELIILILKQLLRDVVINLKVKITDVILTIPTYFTNYQRKLIKDISSFVGLTSLKLLNDQAAAALLYGLNSNKNEIVFIFDFGGGTLDISILEIGSNILETLSVSGDQHIGGDNFDEILIKYILAFLKLSIKNKYILYKIRKLAEKIKIGLSTNQNLKVNLSFLKRNISLNITQSFFKILSINILKKCKEIINRSIIDSKLSARDINEVLILGGSSNLFMIKNLLIQIFNKKLNKKIFRATTLSEGAALQGSIFTGEITNFVLFNVTPFNYNLKIKNLNVKEISLFYRQESIPTINYIKIINSFNPIYILQGESFLKNKIITKLKFSKNLNLLKIKFQINLDGLLFIFLQDKNSKIIANNFINNISSLKFSNQIILKMVKELDHLWNLEDQKFTIFKFKFKINKFIFILKQLFQLLQNINYFYFILLKIIYKKINQILKIDNLEKIYIYLINYIQFILNIISIFFINKF